MSKNEEKKKRILQTISISDTYKILLWSHLGSNQGPSDYESDALTN